MINKGYKNFIYRVPMSVIVDYKGFRAFIFSSMPRDGENKLIHGPNSKDQSYKYSREMERDLEMIG